MSKITITVTDEQIKLLQSGESIIIEPIANKYAKWNPKGGTFQIESDMSVNENQSWRDYALAGMEYEEEAEAQKAAKILRSHARHLAWLSENDDGWKADWSNGHQLKHYVYLHEDSKKSYQIASSRSYHNLNGIYMSKENANKLCKLLNEGIVEF